jgi:hypothetical protein
VSYAAELAKLKRALREYERGKRKTPPRFSGCSVCPEKNGRRPTVETRFGPRCEEHLPAPPPPGFDR